MAQRTCRACGQGYEHPSPGSLSTKRLCEDCAVLPAHFRRVLERHQLELTRLRRELDALKASHAVKVEDPA